MPTTESVGSLLKTKQRTQQDWGVLNVSLFAHQFGALYGDPFVQTFDPPLAETVTCALYVLRKRSFALFVLYCTNTPGEWKPKP
jgi:hypothetical protein